MADLTENNDTLSDANFSGNNATIDLFDGGQRFGGAFIGDNNQAGVVQDVDMLSIDLSCGQTGTVGIVLFLLFG
jgi:hypothetical protein